MPITINNYPNYLKKYRHLKIKPLTSPKQTIAYTMLILSLFTVSFFGFVAIRPTLKTIFELRKQIEDSRLVDEALQKKIDNLIIAQQEYQLIKNLLPLINEALPSEADLTKALLKIENLANEYELTISSLQVGPITYQTKNEDSLVNKEPNGTTATIDIQIQLKGHYQQINKFLEKLFNTRRIITTNSLALSPISQEEGLNLSLKLNTYYLKQ